MRRLTVVFLLFGVVVCGLSCADHPVTASQAQDAAGVADPGTVTAGDTSVPDTALDATAPQDTPLPTDLAATDAPGDPGPVPEDLTVPEDPGGTDVEPPPEGCCYSAADCPGGPASMTCVGAGPGAPGVCRIPPVGDHRCWQDSDCDAPATCHGAIVCDCGAVCKTEQTGVCVQEAGLCTAVDPSWVEEVCNAASTVVFDGSKCVETCPGCCGCDGFCDLTFPSLASCQAACTGGCPVWDGGCDDALPAQPWWAYDGFGCVKIDTCVCEGCPGTFATEGACKACIGAPVGPDGCSRFITALAECPYDLTLPPGPGGCPITTCRQAACAKDADCPAGLMCVAGSCAACHQDSQCAAGSLCRGGRCVSGGGECPVPAPCTSPSCHLVSGSESPCPVCVCDTPTSIPCAEDGECLLFSFFKFAHCVYGRCAQCRQDSECASGRCLPPGLCVGMDPHPSALFGTWLIGWSGGLDHFSYFRFEPDGTLRRGRYEPIGPWSDDIPGLPCDTGWPFPAPMLGTWEPVETESGFLVVKLAINAFCDPGDGWHRRYLFTLGDGGPATLTDVDGDQDLVGMRVPTEACAHDMSFCEAPGF